MTQAERLEQIESDLKELLAVVHTTQDELGGMHNAIVGLHSKVDGVIAFAKSLQGQVEPMVEQIRTRGVMSLLTGGRR